MVQHLTQFDVITAKAILENRGWGQGASISPDGRVCLGAALSLAIYGDNLKVWGNPRQERKLWSFVYRAGWVPSSIEEVGHWWSPLSEIIRRNDSESTTEEDIYTVLDNVAGSFRLGDEHNQHIESLVDERLEQAK